MLIAVPRETRSDEARVAATPGTISTFVEWGWTALVQRDAGLRAGFTDDAYRKAGAEITEAAPGDAELTLVVGPPSPAEVARLRSGSATSRRVSGSFSDAAR